MAGWARADGDGCTISVRVVPRAARPGVSPGPEGLQVRVSAPPVGGRATEEAARRLAEALGVRPSAVTLRSGRRSRAKSFHVAGLAATEAVRRLDPAS